MPSNNDPLTTSARRHAERVFAVLEEQTGANAALHLHYERGKALLFIRAKRIPYFLTDVDRQKEWMRTAEERLLELLNERGKSPGGAAELQKPPSDA